MINTNFECVKGQVHSERGTELRTTEQSEKSFQLKGLLEFRHEVS